MYKELWDEVSKKHVRLYYNDSKREFKTYMYFRADKIYHSYGNLYLDEEHLKELVEIVTYFWETVDSGKRPEVKHVYVGKNVIKINYKRRDRHQMCDRGDYLRILYAFKDENLKPAGYTSVLLNRDKCREMYKILKSALNHMQQQKGFSK